MEQSVWVFIASLILACSGCTQDGSRTGTTRSRSQPVEPQDASRPIVQNLGAGMTATTCKSKHLIKSWDDKTSQYGFCERLGFRVASCEIRRTAATKQAPCEHQWAKEDRRVEIADECMTQDIDLSKVPEMIVTLEACVCGDRWATENICAPKDCRSSIPCMRAAGFEWTPLAETKARR